VWRPTSSQVLQSLQWDHVDFTQRLHLSQWTYLRPNCTNKLKQITNISGEPAFAGFLLVCFLQSFWKDTFESQQQFLGHITQPKGSKHWRTLKALTSLTSTGDNHSLASLFLHLPLYSRWEEYFSLYASSPMLEPLHKQQTTSTPKHLCQVAANHQHVKYSFVHNTTTSSHFWYVTINTHTVAYVN